MSKAKETLEKAYGSVPKEVGFYFVVPFEFRGIRFYLLKIKRWFTR